MDAFLPNHELVIERPSPTVEILILKLGGQTFRVLPCTLAIATQLVMEPKDTLTEIGTHQS